MNNDVGKRAWELMLQLTKLESISESQGEGAIARYVHSVLADHPYFKENPQLLRLDPIENAPGDPAIVAALVRGHGSKTVMFMNHHDVVDIEDYGVLKSKAFDPEELTRSINPETLPQEAGKDLLSGDWVFGRGTMDMLYGLAIQMVMTMDYASNPGELPGNILFVSVPDEENNSLGMRHAIGVIREFQQDFDLNFAAALNSEPHGYTNGGHVIQTGSDGKLLPLIYCFGKETHAGALYEGLNAHLLLAEFTRMLELNPGFSDSAVGEVTFPPTVLRAGDMKQGYNVSTPAAAWAYFNVFTLETTPEIIIDKLVRLGQQAWVNTLERLDMSIRAWNQIGGTSRTIPQFQPKVMTFAQLWQQCLLAHGDDFVQDIDDLAKKLQQQGADLQRLTLELVHETHRLCPDRDPKIVIALAPPFYPPVRNKGQTAKENLALAAARDLQDYATGELGIKMGHEEYHRGISDLSYCMLQDAETVIDSVQANCPSWGRAYHLPLEELAMIDAPALNMGPLGRDVHKFTERIHKPFATQTLPRLIERLVTKLLAD